MKFMRSARISYLMELSKGQRLDMMACSLTGICGVVLSLCFIYYTKRVIDLATAGKSFAQPVIITGALLLLQLGCSALHLWISTTLQVKNGNAIRHRLFGRLLHSRGQELEKMHSGDVMNRIEQDSNAISTLLTTTLPGAVVTLIQLSAAFLFFCWLDPTLPWIVAGVLPLLLPASRIYLKRMRKYTHRIRKSDSRIQSVIQESLQHRTVVKTLEQDGEHIDRLEQLQDTLSQQVNDRMRFSLTARMAVAAVFSGGYLTAFLWGAVRLAAGEITFGTLTAFLQLVNKVQQPVLDLSRLLPSVINALTAADRLMELEAFRQEEVGESIYFAETPDIELEDVTYTYQPGDAPVLSHFTAHIPAGSSVAIVGETGKGKTTLLRLLLALVEPQEGCVRLCATDGSGQSVPVSSRTRSNFVYVPQGNTLFSGTVADNLRMGKPDATEEEMRCVLHVAVADFVYQLPQGVETRLSELGNGLSEGQAQRIAIARALLRPGQIILLDEASSALDADTEARLMKNLRTCCRGKSLIFVTHHAVIIEGCDQCIQL